MLWRSVMTLCGWLVGAIAVTSTAAEPAIAPASLESHFERVVQPFLKTHCLACHGSEKPKGKLDLSVYTSAAAVVKEYRVWDVVRERLEAEEMPPDDAKRQPTAGERKAVVDWIGAIRQREALKNAGDPGPVPARRLSNAEYDYTIRDLTGVDLRPTREFPVDPANEAGFDNSGESLAMSPPLLKKYLAAARFVADHLVFRNRADSTSPPTRSSPIPTATNTASSASFGSTSNTRSITPTTSSPPGAIIIAPSLASRRPHSAISPGSAA